MRDEINFGEEKKGLIKIEEEEIEKMLSSFIKNPWKNTDFAQYHRRLALVIIPLFTLFFLFLYLSSSVFSSSSLFYNSCTVVQKTTPLVNSSSWKEELDRSKIAVCLVGGARKFELTGPSIVENILKEYPNADLFLHSPIDGDSFKFSLLKAAPRLASIRIFKPEPIPETPEVLRLLTPDGSPNGIQGLLQYFSLVEGCLTLIKAYQKERNFTYNWIVRARVDGYWNAPLGSDSFISGTYVVPSESDYMGLNDRHGVGDFNTSIVALSRFSLLPTLIAAGMTNFNSESAFKAQFTTSGTPYVTKRLPFCVVTDRIYEFPPRWTPVGATSSPGPLSGIKCRPCSWVCQGKCVADLMTPLRYGGAWTEWANGTLQLCDPRGFMENGWETVFDIDTGGKWAAWRKQVMALKVDECVRDFEKMRKRTAHWDVVPSEEVCKLGLGTK